MSWTPGIEPVCDDNPSGAHIDTIITGRPRDIGDFSVRRVLPARTRRTVGPFIFFDHMGPAALEPGQGIDVRPHPHINLSTVTYLFDGEILHRDSLGSNQPIRPGAVNWMTAGRGIVHSERTPPALRATGSSLHGIQLWVALPQAHEETDPSFEHYPAESLPDVERDGASLKILAGRAYGAESPVRTHSRLFYVDARVTPGVRLSLPNDYPERALYVASGSIGCGRETLATGQMAVFTRGAAGFEALEPARILLLSGDPLDGLRHLFWNFVSSSEERLEAAKHEWKTWNTTPGRGPRFSLVPDDGDEFIPLPETLGNR